MTTYVDEKGNIIERSGLVDKLHKEAPDLAKQYEEMAVGLAALRMYGQHLYVIPHENERELPVDKREAWNSHIAAIDGQQRFDASSAKSLEALSSIKFDLKGDRVLVIKSERPLFDTVLAENPVGYSEAWIGTVKDYGITNVDESLMSMDGKIYRRVILQDAKKLSLNQFKEWAQTQFTWVYCRQNDHQEKFLEKLRKEDPGKETVMIYDRFPNTDVVLLKHELSDMEKHALNVEKPGYFSYKDIMWERPRKWWPIYAHFKTYEGNPDYRSRMLLGSDSRSPVELYNDIKEIFEEGSKKIKRRHRSGEIKLFIGKHLVHPIDPEFAKDVIDMYNPAEIVKKKILDEGISFSEQTFLNISLLKDKTFITSPEKEALFDALEKELNFKSIISSYSGGHGSSLLEKNICETTDLYLNPNFTHYIGEIFRP